MHNQLNIDFRMPRYMRSDVDETEESIENDFSNEIVWDRKSGMPDNIPAFGQEMRRQFLLGGDNFNKHVAFCNHGSYGATPNYVLEKRFDLLKEIEINPDLWYRSEMLKRELLSTKKLAKFVGANSSNDLIYVDNVTEGINIILKV